MKEPTSESTVEILINVLSKDALELGRLLPHLSQRFSGKPISHELLQTIVDSPFHDQFVVRNSDRIIVGAATISVVIGSGVGMNAHLEDFVVDPTVQNLGIGKKLWDEIISWCEEKKVNTLKFTSNPSRVNAHAFYLKHGAVIRNTSNFSKTITLTSDSPSSLNK